jgi:SHS2 domain-containing protein
VSPYVEVEHTADWALRVWAPTLAELFIDAARGMYALAGAKPGSNLPERRHVELSADDHESLLVAWLQELLYYTESEGLVFGEFQVELLDPPQLKAEVASEKSERLDKVIKAVTYHNLNIRRTNAGYETTIVFDV